jgi:hypothetical protein
MSELLLAEHELGEQLRAWLDEQPSQAFVLSLERQANGQVLLRSIPEINPDVLAQLRVTIAKYHETLMNLS